MKRIGPSNTVEGSRMSYQQAIHNTRATPDKNLKLRKDVGPGFSSPPWAINEENEFNL